MSVNLTSLLRQNEAMKGDRQPHESGWRECFDYSWPERGNGLNGSSITPSDVQPKKNRILDDTASDAGRTLAASIVSGTTPPNSLWFGIDFGIDEDEGDTEEKTWSDNAARKIFKNIHAANFDASAFECSLDIIPAGWFVLYIDEAKGGGYNFEHWPLGQCTIAASKAGGIVDTIFREVEFTVEQLVTEYGIDKVSEKTRKAYQDEKFSEKVKVLHAIYPRRISVENARLSKNLPFASVHLEVDNKHTLKESGYHEFPCCVPRWMLVPGTSYPTGPMANALGSIRTINDIKVSELANLDMAAAGMYVAEDDGVLNPRAIKIGPRKVITANSVESIKPLAPAGKFDVVFSAEERLQAAIRKSLMADQLQPQDGPAMTATEVHARMALIRQLLGPVYGRLQAEYLQPLIIRCFGIAYRAGVLGVAPQSLMGRNYSVRFISPLARAQRLEDVTAMDRFETTLITEAQADPTVLDVYDFEEAARERSDLLGVPQRLMRTEEKVVALRDARKNQQQNDMQQAAGMQMQQVAGQEMIKAAASG